MSTTQLKAFSDAQENHFATSALFGTTQLRALPSGNGYKLYDLFDGPNNG
jgi:hypothetical protein